MLLMADATLPVPTTAAVRIVVRHAQNSRMQEQHEQQKNCAAD
jgi:hypothetical protein